MRDKRGRIMEGPKGGQWTAGPKGLRPEEEAQLNSKLNRKKAKQAGVTLSRFPNTKRKLQERKKKKR